MVISCFSVENTKGPHHSDGMSVSRGKFLKSLGSSVTGFTLGAGIATAAAALARQEKKPASDAPAGGKKMDVPVTFIKNGPAEGQRVALTFDDGPTPSVTDRILDELKQRGLHATFFMI